MSHRALLIFFLRAADQVEHDRPEFKGDTMVSFVDGSPMTYYPPEVRRAAGVDDYIFPVDSPPAWKNCKCELSLASKCMCISTLFL